MFGINICQNVKNKNKKCQVLFVSRTTWAKSPRDLQDMLEVLSGLSWKYHLTLKVIMEEEYGRLISGYEALLNKTEFISSRWNDNNPIRTMAKILETLMIKCPRDSNWFNRPIIYIPAHTRSIIKVLFPNDFLWYLTEIENIIKQLLTVNKFECFFEKVYKIRVAAVISRLLRLIYDDPLLDLTWTQFCRERLIGKHRESLPAKSLTTNK